MKLGERLQQGEMHKSDYPVYTSNKSPSCDYQIWQQLAKK